MPAAGLVARGGNFYGTTYAGGAFGFGTVFKVTPAGALTSLISFINYDFTSTYTSYRPDAGLLLGRDGNLYGTHSVGGESSRGAVFKITPADVFGKVASFGVAFGSDEGTGSTPSAEMIEAQDGNFYGTTSEGGTGNYGSVFKMTPTGVLSTLASFNLTNGSKPAAGLVQGIDGAFYGTTSQGGAHKEGTVFKVTPAGVLTTLVHFDSVINCAFPEGTLVAGKDGNFYGTTRGGGVGHHGTVFMVTPGGVLTRLFSFDGLNGDAPLAGLTLGSDDKFYGTTYEGGATNSGTVFKVTSFYPASFL